MVLHNLATWESSRFQIKGEASPILTPSIPLFWGKTQIFGKTFLLPIHSLASQMLCRDTTVYGHQRKFMAQFECNFVQITQTANFTQYKHPWNE